MFKYQVIKIGKTIWENSWCWLDRILGSKKGSPVNIYGIDLFLTPITKNVQFNTVFCWVMNLKIRYVNINTVVTVPRVVQSIIDFWQVLFICVNNTPGSVWEHFRCPSKYPKTIKISLKKSLEKICWGHLKYGLNKSGDLKSFKSFKPWKILNFNIF